MLRAPAFLLRGIQSRRWARSWLKFSVHGCQWLCCKGFEPLYRGFLWHFSTFFQSDNPTPRLLFQFIKQALCKVAQSTLQQPEHTTKQSIQNQRHGSHLADKWCLWLFAASNTIHMSGGV